MAVCSTKPATVTEYPLYTSGWAPISSNHGPKCAASIVIAFLALSSPGNFPDSDCPLLKELSYAGGDPNEVARVEAKAVYGTASRVTGRRSTRSLSQRVHIWIPLSAVWLLPLLFPPQHPLLPLRPLFSALPSPLQIPGWAWRRTPAMRRTPAAPHASSASAAIHRTGTSRGVTNLAYLPLTRR